MLGDEFGTASNIKSRVNRQSVLGAITSAQQRLKLYNKVFTAAVQLLRQAHAFYKLNLLCGCLACQDLLLSWQTCMQECDSFEPMMLYLCASCCLILVIRDGCRHRTHS